MKCWRLAMRREIAGRRPIGEDGCCRQHWRNPTEARPKGCFCCGAPREVGMLHHLTLEVRQNAVEAAGFPPDGSRSSQWIAFPRNALTSAQKATNRSDGELCFCTGFVRGAKIFILSLQMYENVFFVHFL